MSNSPSTKTTPACGFLLTAAVLAIGLIVYLKSLQSPVLPAPPRPPATIDYSALIRMHGDQASRRNLNALKVFEIDANRVLKEHDAKLTRAARLAAKDAADYRSCCRIVYHLAWDKARGGKRTEAYLNRELGQGTKEDHHDA